jgi:hypothetical protein
MDNAGGPHEKMADNTIIVPILPLMQSDSASSAGLLAADYTIRDGTKMCLTWGNNWIIFETVTATVMHCGAFISWQTVATDVASWLGSTAR